MAWGAAADWRARVARERAFLGASAFLFAASAAATAAWCGSMSGGMAMPGGWSMSMAWMRMPGQGWPGAAASFLGMWVVMMVAMMLPSLTAMLASYRRSVGGVGPARLGALTAVAGAGYFAVWTAVGAVAYPVGAALAAAEMRWPAVARSVPAATGLVLLLAGMVQLSPWKARQLCRCRDGPGASLPAGAATAWGHGLRLGVRCSLCCSGLMAVLLVAGVMDLGAMALVAAAITVERLAPWPRLAAGIAGAAAAAAGALAMARALGAG